MKPIDIVILVGVVLILASIGWFRIWRHRKDKCYGCAEKKSCKTPKGARLLKDYRACYDPKCCK